MKLPSLVRALAAGVVALLAAAPLHAQTPTPAPAGTPAATPIPGTEGSTGSVVGSTPPVEVRRLRRLVRDVQNNTDNSRYAGNFGAQLWLISDGTFFQRWARPTIPDIEPVQLVARGDSLYTAVIFYGEAQTAAGLSNVSYDIAVLRPDGSIYNRRDALVGFQNLAPADDRQLQLGRNFLNINVGPDDPLGVYTVNVTIHDNVSKVDLPLKQTFVVR